MKLFNLVVILSLTVTAFCTSELNSKMRSEPKERVPAKNGISTRIELMSPLFQNKDSKPSAANRTGINSSAKPPLNTDNVSKSASKKLGQDEGKSFLQGTQLSSLPQNGNKNQLSSKGPPPPPPIRGSSLPLSSIKTVSPTTLPPRMKGSSTNSSIKSNFSKSQNDNTIIKRKEPLPSQESKNSCTNDIKQHLRDNDSKVNYFEPIGPFRRITKDYSNATEYIFDYNSNDFTYDFYPCTNLKVFRLHSNIKMVKLDKVLSLMDYDLNVLEIKNAKAEVMKLYDILLLANFNNISNLSLNHVVVDDQSIFFCNLSFMTKLTTLSFTGSPIGNDFVVWLKRNTVKLPWKELYLNSTQLTQESAEILLNCDTLDQLELLELSGNGINFSNLNVTTYEQPSLPVIVIDNRNFMKILTKIQSTGE